MMTGFERHRAAFLLNDELRQVDRSSLGVIIMCLVRLINDNLANQDLEAVARPLNESGCKVEIG